ARQAGARGDVGVRSRGRGRRCRRGSLVAVLAVVGPHHHGEHADDRERKAEQDGRHLEERTRVGLYARVDGRRITDHRCQLLLCVVSAAGEVGRDELRDLLAAPRRGLARGGPLERGAEVVEVVRERDVPEVDAEALEHASALERPAGPIALPERTPAARALLVVADRRSQLAGRFHGRMVALRRTRLIVARPEARCGFPARERPGVCPWVYASRSAGACVSRRRRSAQTSASRKRIPSLARHHWQIASITATWITIR